jgi:AcrR family transcriptional regulator
MNGDRRTEILDAALASFSERGYASTTIADLRRRSGASVGSIYHRFGDKEGVAAELYLECLTDYQRGVAALLERGPGAEDGIKGLVRHHLCWVESNPRRAAFLLDHREAEASAGERLRELNLELLDRVREWLDPHVAAGRIRGMPLQLLYVIVIGPSQEYARHWLRDPERGPIRRAERPLADAAWNAVRADRKALR